MHRNADIGNNSSSKEKQAAAKKHLKRSHDSSNESGPDRHPQKKHRQAISLNAKDIKSTKQFMEMPLSPAPRTTTPVSFFPSLSISQFSVPRMPLRFNLPRVFPKDIKKDRVKEEEKKEKEEL